MAENRRAAAEDRHRGEYVDCWRRYNTPTFASNPHDFALACMAALFAGSVKGIAGRRPASKRNADQAAEARAFAAAWDEVMALRDAEIATERAAVEAGKRAALAASGEVDGQ
jgi:hypothetical protein